MLVYKLNFGVFLIISINLRELRALPQGRGFTHVMARGVGRQCREGARAGSDLDDSYTLLRPQASET